MVKDGIITLGRDDMRAIQLQLRQQLQRLPPIHFIEGNTIQIFNNSYYLTVY